MKTKIVLLFLLGWVGMVFGQENDIKEGGNYYFNNISLNDLSSLKEGALLCGSCTIQDVKKKISGKKYRVTVNKIGTKNDSVYFKFWAFKKDTVTNILINNALPPKKWWQKPLSSKKTVKKVVVNNDTLTFDTNEDSRIVYVMSLDVFKNSTKPLYNRVDWRVGVYTVPIKIRFSNFSFDPNANLGANLGAKIKWNRERDNSFALEPIAGFGLASIKLDESNSNIMGIIEGDTEENAKKSTNVSAFTANIGLLIHIKNTINIGLTYGFDKISKNDQTNYGWKYNGKGWLGIGINVAFSNQNNTGEATSN